MHYRTRLKALLAVITVLTLVLTATFVFDISQNATFAWISASVRDKVDSIEITKDSFALYLVKESSTWTVSRDGTLYPAKHSRVEDLLQILSRSKSYPVYSNTESSHEKLGLTADTAYRIVARAGNEVVLDLFIGDSNAASTERYLRENGSNEVRLGLDTLSGYLSSPVSACVT